VREGLGVLRGFDGAETEEREGFRVLSYSNFFQIMVKRSIFIILSIIFKKH
jgi:hypothetical protein